VWHQTEILQFESDFDLSSVHSQLWHLFFLGIGQRSHLEVCSGHGTLDAAQKAVEVLRRGKLAWKVVAA